MNEVVLVKQVSDLSIFFSLLNFAAILIDKPKLGLESFMLSLIIIYCIYVMRLKGKKTAYLLLLAMVVLFGLSQDMYDALYYGVIIMYTIYISFKISYAAKYGEERELFKKRILVVFAILLYSLFSDLSISIEEVVIPYILIFAISSVVLLRTLRYREFNPNTKDINKINLKFAAVLSALSIIMAIENVRKLLSEVIGTLYNAVTQVFVKVFLFISLGLGFLVQKAVEYLKGIINPKTIRRPDILATGLPPKPEEANESTFEQAMHSQLVQDIIKFIVACIVIYLVFRVFKSKSQSKEVTEEFRESRESIDKKKVGQQSFLRAVTAVLKPKNYKDYVRFYYRKFMLNSIKRGIDITNKDTTLQIEQKSRETYDKNLLSKMRSIYIRVRYGNVEVDKDVAKMFADCYKEVNKSKK